MSEKDERFQPFYKGEVVRSKAHTPFKKRDSRFENGEWKGARFN